LENTSLIKAGLSEADFEGSVESGDEGEEGESAFLEATDLSNAALYGTKLKGVDLSRAKNLTWNQVKWAETDNRTKLPDYLLAAPESERQGD
jgi:uncharacterized protein YjbI with pentapeptide repeats